MGKGKCSIILWLISVLQWAWIPGLWPSQIFLNFCSHPLTWNRKARGSCSRENALYRIRPWYNFIHPWKILLWRVLWLFFTMIIPAGAMKGSFLDLHHEEFLDVEVRHTHPSSPPHNCSHQEFLILKVGPEICQVYLCVSTSLWLQWPLFQTNRSQLWDFRVIVCPLISVPSQIKEMSLIFSLFNFILLKGWKYWLPSNMRKLKLKV